LRIQALPTLAVRFLYHILVLSSNMRTVHSPLITEETFCRPGPQIPPHYWTRMSFSLLLALLNISLTRGTSLQPTFCCYLSEYFPHPTLGFPCPIHSISPRIPYSFRKYVLRIHLIRSYVRWLRSLFALCEFEDFNSGDPHVFFA